MHSAQSKEGRRGDGKIARVRAARVHAHALCVPVSVSASKWSFKERLRRVSEGKGSIMSCGHVPTFMASAFLTHIIYGAPTQTHTCKHRQTCLHAHTYTRIHTDTNTQTFKREKGALRDENKSLGDED